MTFSQTIKEEIITNQYDEQNLKCLLSAFLKSNIAINISKNKITWETKVKSNQIIRFITQSLMNLYDIDKTLSFSKTNKLKNQTTYKLEFEGDLNKIENELYIFKSPIDLFKDQENKNAFLAGAFLSGGSVNSPSSSNYHFEIRSHNFDLIESVKMIIDEMNIKSKIMERNNIFVLYVKKSESISDLLKYINANNSMFAYEDKRIYRDYSNQMQRLNNLDVSNLKKTVEASNEQIKWIKLIKQNKLLFDSLSNKEKIFCELRLDNHDATLNNLVDMFKEKYNIDVTRTGLNHYVRKLKSIYLNHFNKKK